MTLPTDRQPQEIIESSDLNAISAAYNALQEALAGKQDAGSYISQLQLDTAIGTRAPMEHNHNGNAINAGTVASARLFQATTAARGASELATNAEALAGTDSVRTITPSTLNYVSNQRYIRNDNNAGTWSFVLYGAGGGSASLGNSTVDQWQVKIGDVCWFSVCLVIGSTFSHTGIGAWMPSLPYMPNQLLSNQGISMHVTSSSVTGSPGETVGSAKIESNGQQRITRSYIKTNTSGQSILLNDSREWATGDRIMWFGAYKTSG